MEFGSSKVLFSVEQKLTSILKDLLIWLYHRAETVEDQCSQFGGTAFRRLVIVQRV